MRRFGIVPPFLLCFGGRGGCCERNLADAGVFWGPAPTTIFHFAGRGDSDRLATDNPRHRIVPYEDELWHPLAASDVGVMRAGAGSLFDTAATGRAAIVIPYPYATGGHQLHNARYFTERGAAELMRDEEVTADALRARVEALLEDEARREKLAANMRALATPEAASEVAGRLLAAANAQRRKA